MRADVSRRSEVIKLKNMQAETRENKMSSSAGDKHSMIKTMLQMQKAQKSRNKLQRQKLTH